MRSHSDDTLFFSERAFQNQNKVVDYSIAQMTSAEYEQDCFHYVLSEMQIGDKDEVS